VHLLTSGEIVEVCGTQTRQLYSTSLRESLGAPPSYPDNAVPFFGLSVLSGSLWASGIDGLYQIDAGGRAKFFKYPWFKRVGGVDLTSICPTSSSLKLISMRVVPSAERFRY